MPPRKRAASSAADEETPARRPRRTRTPAAAVATKSPYFEHGGDEHEDEDEDDGHVPVSSARKPRGRPPTRSSKATAVAAAAAVGNDTPAKRGRGRPKNKVQAPPAESEEEVDYVEKEDVKKKEEEEAYVGQEDGENDDDDDDDGGRTVTVIPLKQLRPDGGVRYKNDRLHPNTMLFIQELKVHNQRPWLKSNDGEFRRALKNFYTYIETFTPLLVGIDDTIPGELPIKDVVFRIYRDTRFSKDPTPYKPYFSAAWSRTGRKGPYAVYYMHCEPSPIDDGVSSKGKGKGKGKGTGDKPLDEWSTSKGSGGCMLAGGLWCPGKDALALLRRSIDERPRRWRRVLGDPVLAHEFFGGHHKGGDDDQEAMVRAFAEHSSSGALKTRPRDYSPDHRDIALLKLRNFVLTKRIPEEIFTAPGGQRRIAEIFGAMAGFVSFLNSIVMPDPVLDGQNDADDDDAADDDDDDEN
jgi:uncharacterized protein (DUF2461 family)